MTRSSPRLSAPAALLLLCVAAGLARAQVCGTRRVYFISPTGTGDGSAPHSAASLDSVLSGGVPAGSHLKLLAGTHSTTQTFELADDVRIEGGYVRSFDPLLPLPPVFNSSSNASWPYPVYNATSPPPTSWVDWAKVRHSAVVFCLVEVVFLSRDRHLGS
jgi:hypothetical protein